MKLFLVAIFLISLAFIPGYTQPIEDDNENLRVGRCDSLACDGGWQPVCASNNDCMRLFGNECEVRRYNCRASPNQRYNIVPNHYCSDGKSRRCWE